jgi:hypothetical protein
MTISRNQIAVALRVLVEDAELDDTEADPKVVNALAEALGLTAARSLEAAEFRALNASREKPARQHDTLTPIAGGWRAINLTDKFIGAALDGDTRVNLAPGENHLPQGFSGVFAEERGRPSPASAYVERGELLLLPPGALDTTGWQDKLSPSAWQRRAQACANAPQSDGALLRECLPHLAGAIRQNYERVIERLVTEAGSKPAKPSPETRPAYTPAALGGLVE